MQITVYSLETDLLSDTLLYQKAFDLCPEQRREKANRYRNAADRRLCVGAWLLLRYMLGQRKINANEQLLALNPWGKPYFPALPQVKFNLSHAGETVLCAVSEFEIGCDIERTDRLPEQVARRCFHPLEMEALRSCSCTATEIWTCKESVVKCLGTGLRTPFQSFSVCADAMLSETVRLGADQLHLSVLFSNEKYTAACCLKTAETKPEISIFPVELMRILR